MKKGTDTRHTQLMNDAYHIKTPACIAYCKRLCNIQDLITKLSKELKKGGPKPRGLKFQIESLRNERNTLRWRVREEIKAAKAG